VTPENASPALRALTAAALVLPGLMLPSAHAAEGDEVDFQYSRYQEGERHPLSTFLSFSGVPSIKNLPNNNPIEVDGLHGTAKVTLADRVKLVFNYNQDTWSGATPIATAPAAFGMNSTANFTINGPKTTTVTGASPYVQSIGSFGGAAFDARLNPLRLNPDFLSYTQDTRLAHTLSSASPETRKQGDFRLGYEWDEAAVDAGGGISLENDYESRFASLGGRLDFNQKLTTVNLGLSYTNSHTKALIDHDANPYIDTTAFDHQISVDEATGAKTLSGNRQDWAANLSLTQVLTKDAVIQTGAGYTRSTGYMENPYKVVETFFVNPDPNFSGIPGVFLAGDAHAFLEQRPDVRNQWTWDVRYVQHVPWVDAAVHLGYRYYHDDWDVDAHTFDADWAQPLGHGWTVTPRVRYYSQDAADFYHPFLAVLGDPGSSEARLKKLPGSFSSDHRLSGYGALSGGVTVNKQFAKGVSLEAGFEYYTHEGSLKLGSGGEEDFADFDYWVANAALKVNLSALGGGGGAGDHHHHHGHHAGHAPAGVMFDHMLSRAGDFMAGYRYMYSRQAGDLLHGTDEASDATIIAQGCGDSACWRAPEEMDMHMHMLDLMYAPTDWLNLMLMPQFVDMEMTLRDLDGATAPAGIPDHGDHPHSTGGVGDTSLYALVKLLDLSGHLVHATLGVSAPTGEVGIKLRRNHGHDPGFIHYGMQLGSGTWDFRPSLTYTGRVEDWSWGAQLSGTTRLEDRNDEGFAFGDLFQSTAWAGYNPLDWLTVSVRGVYTLQGELKGEFTVPNDRSGPMDFGASYGGRYWDVGFGVSAMVPGGDFRGNRVAVEWLQPVEDDVNGFQLERVGTLSASWNLAF
jgi:hypothetical protein